MTNTISVPKELLERIDECAICDGTDATIDGELFNRLVGLLSAPAAEVEGLEVIGFHCMDSAGIETLEWRGGSYADEPLCSLPKAQAVIEQYKQDALRFRLFAETVVADCNGTTMTPQQAALFGCMNSVTNVTLGELSTMLDKAMKGEGDEISN